MGACSSTWAVRQRATPVAVQLTAEQRLSHELAVSGAGKADRGAKGKLLATHHRVRRRPRMTAVHLCTTGTGSTDRNQTVSAVKDKLTQSFIMLPASVHIGVHADSPGSVPQR